MNSKNDSTSNLFCHRIASFLGEARFLWCYEKGRPSIKRIILPKTGTEMGNEGETAAQGENCVDMRINEFGGLISDYLQGSVVTFPLDLVDLGKCNIFQRRVLEEAFLIPRGRVISYGGLAERIGIPRAARAVGTALARNPFPIVFPCHRIVRASGDIGRFGGDPPMKKALLEMEGVRFTTEAIIEDISFWH